MFASQRTSSTYAIDNQLSYELDGPCDFIFMIHVANCPQQRLIQESLETSQILPHGGMSTPTATE